MYIWQYTSSSYGVLFQSVAVSTMRRRSARPEAFLHAKERPMFRGLRSASTEHNQVWLGLPAGLLQSGRGLRIAAESTTSTSPSATWTVGHGAGLPNWIILVLDQLIWSPKAAASSCITVRARTRTSSISASNATSSAKPMSVKISCS